MSKSTLNHKGISHILLPLAVVVLISAVGTYMLVQSHANTKKGKLTRHELSYFKEATRQYFQDGEAMQKAPCKPEYVRVKYYYGGSLSEQDERRGAFAYAYMYAGFRKLPREILPDTTKIPSSQYCKIFWNLTSASGLSIANQCITFMHEYGWEESIIRILTA
jgi:hypothetical protein